MINYCFWQSFICSWLQKRAFLLVTNQPIWYWREESRSELTVRGEINRLGKFGDVHFKTLLNLVQHLRVRLVRHERYRETLCTKATGSSHLQTETTGYRHSKLTQMISQALHRTAEALISHQKWTLVLSDNKLMLTSQSNLTQHRTQFAPSPGHWLERKLCIVWKGLTLCRYVSESSGVS